MRVSGKAAGRRCIAIAAGLLADELMGEPPAALHPVAAFGRLMTEVEARLYAPQRAAGVAYAFTGLALGILAGAAGRMTGPAVALTVAGRRLRETALQVQVALAARDLGSARALLPALVGRDPSELDGSGVAAAAIESIAENTVDAIVAPACWALAGGSTGAAGYRAVNTLDAMVGHRSARYERFGWCSARLDDVANFVPARLTVALVTAVRPWAAGKIGRAVREDAPAHPSPNAGVAEAAFAAALGVELGGTLRYGARVEERPLLGRGRRPGSADIVAAVRLSNDVELALFCALVALGCWRGWRR
jgi:adenosylcobinamide-phosphate synthase